MTIYIMNKKTVETKVVREGNTDSLTNKPAKTWELTLNNPKEADKLWIQSLEFSKCAIYEEIAPNTGTVHWQGQITFKRSYRLNALKKLHHRIHWEITKAIADANYARKIDSKVILDIDNRQQGKRTDLLEVRDRIMNGITVDQITLENPELVHQYGRTLDRLEDIYLRSLHRTEMTTGVWYYGPTATGKSHKAFENFHPDTHYVWKNDNGWWDGYKGQETVIINDFRGEISYNTLLQMIDKWPFYVKRRNRQPMPFLSKKVIITSSLAPDMIYCHRDFEDSIEQLLRRIDVVKMRQKFIKP